MVAAARHVGDGHGAPAQPFCRNGSWVADGYDGAQLTMVVADSCGDANAWCRDDPGHLDLVTASLNRFVKNGVPVGDMSPAHWNNRRISWSLAPAPGYTGDLKIGFLQAPSGTGPRSPFRTCPTVSTAWSTSARTAAGIRPSRTATWDRPS